MMEEILKRTFWNARLYRPLVAGTLIALLALPSAAQLRTTKPKQGPRAIAVVRWQPNAQGKAVARLLPVAIVEDGKFYDAGLYRATPRPMALEPGVVYEAQDKGEVLGYFTVKNAARNPSTRQWFGAGEWQGATRSSAELEMRKRPQTAEVVTETKGTSPIFTEPVDDRDIKKKSTVYDEEGKEVPAGQEEDQPPTLKRGGKVEPIDRLPKVAPPKKEAPKPTTADDDPDRPKLKRGAPEAGTATAPSSSAPERPAPKNAPAASTGDDDPNRPILRRGGPGQQKTGTESEQSAGAPVPARVQARGDVPASLTRTASGFAIRTFEAVAVSDAEEAEFRNDYRFRWNESEREEITQRLRKLAVAEATKVLQASGRLPAPAARTSRGPTVIPLELADTQLAGLDVDANNSAELVYTGRGSLEGGKAVYVTLVARTDVEGNPRKLFSVVTTSDRLDVSPRLEFVDVVDADGDGRGELLFRRIRDTAAEFVLYRVGVDTLTELFHGGNAE